MKIIKFIIGCLCPYDRKLNIEYWVVMAIMILTIVLLKSL